MGDTVREILTYLGFVVLAGLLWWSLSREKHDQLLVTEHLKAEIEQQKTETENAVEAYTEKVLDVAIELPELPEGVQLRLFPAHVRVTIRLKEEDYAAVTAENLRATVSLGSSIDKITSSDLLKVNVRPKDRDKRFKVVRREPEAVEYLLEDNR